MALQYLLIPVCEKYPSNLATHFADWSQDFCKRNYVQMYKHRDIDASLLCYRCYHQQTRESNKDSSDIHSLKRVPNHTGNPDNFTWIIPWSMSLILRNPARESSASLEQILQSATALVGSWLNAVEERGTLLFRQSGQSPSDPGGIEI